MFQHAPPGYRFRRLFRLADLRVSKPERLLYDSRPTFVKRRQRGFVVRAAHSLIRRLLEAYAVGVAYRRCRRHRHRVRKRVVGAIRDVEVPGDLRIVDVVARHDRRAR